MNDYAVAGHCGCSAFALVPALVVGVGFAGMAVVSFRDWLAERRAIARALRPVDPWACVDDRAVSAAIGTYVWGLPRQAVPGEHHADVRRWYGIRAGPLLERVAERLETAYRIPDWSMDTPEVAARRIAESLSGTGLTEGAVRAVVAWVVHSRAEWAPEALARPRGDPRTAR